MRPYPLTPDALVDDVLADLDAVSETVRERFGGLTDEQLAWQPAPHRWGVGHCLVHLARVNQLYRDALTKSIRAARTAGGAPPAQVRGRWFGRVFTRLQGPGGLKVKTPSPTRPRQEAVAAGSLETFFAEQHRLRGATEEARGLDLDGVEVVSPLSSRLKFTVGDALRILAAHEARHLVQAERVVADPRFPG